MVGRKKTTNEQKILRGTDQPCRMTPQTVSNGMSEIPKVKLKGSAKKIFEYTAYELINKGLMEIVSLDLLVAYAREMSIYHDLMREVEKEGFTIEVETKNGTTTIVNPKTQSSRGGTHQCQVHRIGVWIYTCQPNADCRTDSPETESGRLCRV